MCLYWFIWNKTNIWKIPAWPLSPFGTIANVGPMTRTVRDGAMLYAQISQPDWRDWHASSTMDSNFINRLGEGIKGKKIAIVRILEWALSGIWNLWKKM